MLTLYKRNKVFWVRGTVNGVKVRETTRCNTAKAAEAFRKQLEIDLVDPNYRSSRSATIRSAAERFLKELAHEGKSAGTVNMYECKVQHLVRLMGDVRLGVLSRSDVVQYIEQRKTETAHPHTIHRELTALRRTLRSAAGANEFSKDPKSILPRFSSGYVPRTRFLTPEELDAVMAELDPGRAAVLAFAVSTAADYSSIFQARRSDIKDKSILVRGTKTSSRLRTVPRLSMFAKYVAYVEKHADGPGELLFRPWGNMPRDLMAACKRSEISKFTARDLRRTAGTWILKQGGAINLAAKFMGHANTMMLIKIYGQLDSEDVGRLLEEQTTKGRVLAMYTTPSKRPDSKEHVDDETR